MKTKYKYDPAKGIDEQYREYAAQEGLYCIAAFGYHSTINQRKKLAYIWDRLLSQKLKAKGVKL